jgi:hypothetical protein
LVERRPEKAGVASSILAPGTTRSRHRFFSEEIYFAMSKTAAWAYPRQAGSHVQSGLPE